MRKIVSVGIVIIFVAIFSNCNNSQKPEITPVKTTKLHYQCPMKCTEEIFEKPEVCPVCKTKLIKITKS